MKKYYRYNIARFFALNVLCSSLLVCSEYVYADDFVEFDVGFLQGLPNGQKIDISRFSYSNVANEGDYIADVEVNGEYRGRIQIRFIDIPEQNKAELCATPALLSVLDLKKEAISLQTHSAKCDLFSQTIPSAKYQFNLATLTLNVDIPQAFLIQRPRGYISPTRWQTGVPVGFVRYYVNHYQNQNEQRYDQTFLSLNTGINLGNWALRHQGSQTWSEGKRLSYQSNSTYLQRDVPWLRGQLIIGDFTTSGSLLDSVSMRGVQLASDDRMLASSEQGYAPTIRGIANTNALVTIRQNGNVLREVSVPAGPFSINDLYPTGYAGDIEVEIRETNGEIRKFTIPYTATAQLMRPGYSRYMFAMGRYRYANKLYSEKVFQASWQYGLSNNITLNIGTTLSRGYHSELVGMAFNTPIGAFSTNVTLSRAKFSGNRVFAYGKSDKLRGYNLYASYNTRIDPTNTNVTLAAYRYLSRNYYSLQDFIINNNDYFYEPRKFTLLETSYRPKNQFQVTINQQLNDNWGTLYLIGNINNYWGNRKKNFDYQIGYSNSYKRVNYNLSFYQTRNSTGIKDKQVYLSLSFNLGSGRNSPYLSQSMTQSKQNGLSTYTNVSGTLGETQRYSYNLSLNHYSNSYTNVSFNNSYLSPYARVDASWSKTNDGSQQVSAGISGAIVAHPKGITLANDLSDTFAIIHAKGAKGAKINGTIGNEIDGFGNGIMPYLTPYNINSVGIDINNIPDTVELSATQEEVIPRANSAVLVSFDTQYGYVVFFELQDQEDLPPLGTEVFNQQGENVGIVAQGGRIYTRGIAEKGGLTLNWADRHCNISYKLPEDAEQDGQPIILPVRCEK